MAFLTNPLVGLTLLVFAAYFGSLFLFETPSILQVLSYPILTLTLAVAIIYLPEYFRDLWAGKHERDTHLKGGISYAFVADFMAAGWTALAWIIDADWMRTHWFVGVYIILLSLGAVLHISAPRARGAPIPRRNLWILGVALVIGFGYGIASVVLGLERGLSLAPI